MATDFHFISPAWLLALIPLATLLWLVARRDAGTEAWRRVIDPRLLSVLSVDGGARRRLPLSLLGLGVLVAVIALANPTFERRPTPAFRADAARVIVLDLSRSMLADDLTPSRLLRARYKVADILARSADGQAALIAFAGAPFAVAPLSDDTKTIAALLDALSPDVMPVQGSRVDLAIGEAQALLEQAGARDGEVVLLTDDAGDERALAAGRKLAEAGHRLAVIGVGTEAGGAVPGVSSSTGPITAKLDPRALSRLAKAGDGSYSPLTPTAQDLDRVLRQPGSAGAVVDSDDPRLTDAWHELGPWITLLLLPLGMLAFRRGWLAVLVLAMPLWMAEPASVLASGWDDLWQRRDQQATAALEAGDPARALELAPTAAHRGTASYRLGDYAAAADAFAAGETGVDQYNRGNSLALGGRLEEALAAYDEALERVGGDNALRDDVTYNRAQVEALLKQQQQQQSQDEQSQDQSGEQQGQSGPSDQSQGQGGQQQDQQGQGQDQQSAGQGDEHEQAGQSGGDQQQGQDQAEAQDQQQADAEAASAQGAEDQSESQDGSEQGQDQADAQSSGSAAGAESADAENDEQGGNDSSSQSSNGQQDQAQGTQGEGELDAPMQPDQDQLEQAAADYRDAAAAAHADQAEQGGEPGAAGTDIAALSPEEREARQAAEQWLRRIPDDPAGLLRRKFLYQYRQRATDEAGIDAGNPW
jgi:Ca-activated chloride channel family protein